MAHVEVRSPYAGHRVGVEFAGVAPLERALDVAEAYHRRRPGWLPPHDRIAGLSGLRRS